MIDGTGTDIWVGAMAEVLTDQAIDGYITEGKQYQVTGLQEEAGRVIITDDTGREGWYRATRFRVPQHFSELP